MRILSALVLLLLVACNGGGHESHTLKPPAPPDRHWQVDSGTSWTLCYDTVPTGFQCIAGSGNRTVDTPDDVQVCAELVLDANGVSTLTCMPDAIIFGPILNNGDSVFGCCGP